MLHLHTRKGCKDFGIWGFSLLSHQLNSLLDGMDDRRQGKVDVQWVDAGEAQEEKAVSADGPSIGALHKALHGV